MSPADRATVRAAISNAYYEARESGETMETAADRAANAVLDLLEAPGLLGDAQLHEIGMALATLEAAVGDTPEAFRVGPDHAAIVGDGAVFALAMRGFVVVHDHAAAAIVAARYERSPEQTARLQ